MSKIVLEKINLRHSEDWYGNNAAVSCPLCSKTFIVSAFLNKGRRECPSCGRSFAHIDGGSIIIEWIEQEKFPVMSRAELEKRNRLKEFVALVQSGGAVDKISIEHNLPSAQSIAFIEQNGSMVAAAAKKEPRPHYAETISRHSGYELPPGIPELGYVVVDEKFRGQKLSGKVIGTILSTFGNGPIFATTSDDRIKKLLARNGFRWVGHEWRSDRTGQLLSLWLRSEADQSMSNEAIYRYLFSGKKGKKALENALDIRNFEIGLYWQRAAYFWALIAAAFAGYFAILGAEHLDDKKYLAFIVGCIGLLFTWAWFLVNRGSKYWQENWENHVDMLEDAVTGPLYKTILRRSPPQKPVEKYILGPLDISVSKINQWVSLFTLCIWAVLVWNALPQFRLSAQVSTGRVFIISVTVLFGYVMWWKGKTHKQHPPRLMQKREAHIQ